MIEDTQIKTEISPFAMRENEIKVFDGVDKYVSVNQIVHKTDLGHINELHFKILEIINKFEFITSRQLYQLLQYMGVDVKSQDKLNNKLEGLLKIKTITRYYFDSESGKGIYRLYCLEKMGKYLLNSRGIETKWQPTDNTKPVAMIKKRLAGNQILLAYLRKVKSVTGEYKVKPELNAKNNMKKFKATGGSIELSKNKKSIDFVFEIIRREEEWEKKLIERVRLYQDFYETFSPEDSGFRKMPQLIFVCEDDKHMAETFKEIIKSEIEIPQIKLYFTTDLKQNEETLTKTLTEIKFDEETKKYKAEILELKLLD